jgi:hypothetical protein
MEARVRLISLEVPAVAVMDFILEADTDAPSDTLYGYRLTNTRMQRRR